MSAFYTKVYYVNFLYKAYIFTQPKTDSKQRPEMDEDSSMEWNTGQVYNFGKETFLGST